MFPMPENFEKMSIDEKRDARMKAWAEVAMPFPTPEAEKGYRQRAKMLIDVVNLKKPERIPIVPWWGVYPAHYAGYTVQEVTYDYEKLGAAWKKANADFLPDALISAALIGPGKVFDLLDVKNYKLARTWRSC